MVERWHGTNMAQCGQNHSEVGLEFLYAFEIRRSFFNVEIDQKTCIVVYTGKSLSEALILASTNPQYDKRLFIELRVQYMKIPSSEHVENMLCTQIVFCFDIQNNLCTQHVLSL